MVKFRLALLDFAPPTEEPRDEDHEINTSIEDEDDKTLLALALDVDNAGFCQALLEAGADANQYDDVLGVYPIHVAVLNDALDHVEALLANPKNRADVDATMEQNGQTALHLAAERAADSTAILEEVLEHTKNVNAKDDIGHQTPLYLAATAAKNKKAVTLLLQRDAHLHDKVGSVFVSEAIRRQFADFDPESVPRASLPRDQKQADLNALFDALEHQSYKDFKRILVDVDKSQVSEGSFKNETLLQKACFMNLPHVVAKLLKFGVDPNVKTKQTPLPPLLIAAERGHHQILTEMRRYSSATSCLKPVRFDADHDRKTVLHWVLIKTLRREFEGVEEMQLKKEPLRALDQHYRQCFDAIVADEPDGPLRDSNTRYARVLRRMVNLQDANGNTPLHYAVAKWPSGVVRQLLDLGANVGIQNLWDQRPLSGISASTLDAFLNERCLAATTYDQTGNDGDDPVVDYFEAMNDPEIALSNYQANADKFKVCFRYGFIAPPTRQEGSDPEGQAGLDAAPVPEMEVLWHISQSPEHRALVTHPVVRSYVWIKWRRMRPFFNRNLRLSVLLVFCLTWYIFVHFGGLQLNAVFTGAADPEPFCRDLDYPWTTGDYRSVWYVLFLLTGVVQVAFMVRDFYKDALALHGRHHAMSRPHVVALTLLTEWLDLGVLALMVLIAVKADHVLWFVLAVLLGFSGLRELLQMGTSLSRYLRYCGNVMDVLVIGGAAIVVYLPNSLVRNPSSLALGLCGEKDEAPAFDDVCSVKRCLAAIVIVLSWIKILTTVGRHPSLGRFNVYVSIFYRVVKRFCAVLLWYSALIVSFGLGFYIMLHKDTGKPLEETAEECGDDRYPFFDHPWLSLVKACTMFVGEIEFADIPIQGGNVSVTLGYLFLLAFVFLIIVVLMNLLNGLAIADIGEILQESNIISGVADIETLFNIESVLMGNPRGLSDLDASGWSLVNLLKKCCPGVARFFRKISVSAGMLTFHATERKHMVLPLSNSATRCSCCPFGVGDLMAGLNSGNEQIVDDAKAIILERQTANASETLEAKIQSLTESHTRLSQQIAALTKLIDLKLPN